MSGRWFRSLALIVCSAVAATGCSVDIALTAGTETAVTVQAHSAGPERAAAAPPNGAGLSDTTAPDTGSFDAAEPSETAEPSDTGSLDGAEPSDTAASDTAASDTAASATTDGQPDDQTRDDFERPDKEAKGNDAADVEPEPEPEPEPDIEPEPEPEPQEVRDQILPDQPIESEPPVRPDTTTTSESPFVDTVGGGGIDFDLTRDDVDCAEDQLSAFDDTTFVVAHVVVDGNLGGVCFGESDPRLEEAWQILGAITPAGQLHDLALFGGYESTEEGETTLAFVNTLDYEGTIYQMSINLDEAEADVDELRLTMAHEFSHVFTSLESQIDRFVLPKDCTTWDNGEGCFRDDSLMWEWVQLFWGPALLAEIDPTSEPSSSEGEARCDLDSGFLGPYAASSPEEDFAESFSAFVFQLDVDTPGLQAKMDWFARQPGLVEFQDLAIEAGYGPQHNYFSDCG